jgi:hypothetical protein
MDGSFVSSRPLGMLVPEALALACASVCGVEAVAALPVGGDAEVEACRSTAV